MVSPLPRLTLAVLAAGMLTMTACVGAPVATPSPTPLGVSQPQTAQAATPAPQRGGRLVEGAAQLPTQWDPAIADFSHINTIAKLYSNLLWNPGGNTIECDLCSSFEEQDGGRKMVFKLRSGVKFHDGRPLTSADVAYSLNKVMGKVDRVRAPRIGFLDGYVDRIETPDPGTVVLNLPRPAKEVAAILVTVYAGIIPNGTKREDLQKGPLGSGPFVLKELVSGSHAILARNPNYYKPGLPYLDEVEMRVVARGVATESAFVTGRLDVFIGRDPTSRDNEEQFRNLKREGKIKGDDLPSLGPNFIVLNITKAPLNNVELRRAIHLAVDRDAACQVLYAGKCAPSVLFSPLNEWGRSAAEFTTLEGFRRPKDQDVAEAKGIVQRLYPQGLTVEVLQNATPGSPPNPEALFYIGALRTIGITGQVRTVEGTQFNPTLAKGDFQVAAMQLSMTTSDPDEMIANLRAPERSARNNTGYRSDDLERIFVQQSQEGDVNKRRQLIREAEALFLKDLPMIPVIDVLLPHYWWSKVQFTPGMTRHTQEKMETVWIRQ